MEYITEQFCPQVEKMEMPSVIDSGQEAYTKAVEEGVLGEALDP